MERGRLATVDDAPLIERATYAFFHPDANGDGRLDAVLAGLRQDTASGEAPGT